MSVVGDFSIFHSIGNLNISLSLSLSTLFKNSYYFLSLILSRALRFVVELLIASLILVISLPSVIERFSPIAIAHLRLAQGFAT